MYATAPYALSLASAKTCKEQDLLLGDTMRSTSKGKTLFRSCKYVRHKSSIFGGTRSSHESCIMIHTSVV